MDLNRHPFGLDGVQPRLDGGKCWGLSRGKDGHTLGRRGRDGWKQQAWRLLASFALIDRNKLSRMDVEVPWDPCAHLGGKCGFRHFPRRGVSGSVVMIIAKPA